MNRPKIQGVQRTNQAPPRRKRSHGQALVEFAVVLPVFLLILSGVLDFGFLLYSRIAAINAIKETAQCGATGPCTVDATGHPWTWSQMTTAASPIGTASGLTLTFACVQPIPSAPICPAPAALPGTSLNAVTNDAVQATGTYQYHTFFPLLFGAKINVSVSTEMVIFPPPPPN